MVDKNTDFFKYINNFAKTERIPSIEVIKSTIAFKPKVTIAIPTYKRSNLLKEAIDSAIKQENYNDYDIIVVDNDPERFCETERLIRSNPNPRLSYYKNSENLGMAGNWNRLFTLAKGEYVVMLHDDDLLLPNFLKKTTDIVTNNNEIDFLRPTYHPFYDEINEEEINSLPKFSEKLKKLNFFSFYSGNIVGAPIGVVIKKSAMLNFGGFNQDFYPSLDFCFFAFFSKYHKIYFYDDCLALYRYFQNESLKNETLNNYIKLNYYLVSKILKEYFIPNFIIKNYLGHNLPKTVQIYKDVVNPNFEFDDENLGWIKTNNNFMGIISDKFLISIDLGLKFISLIRAKVGC